MEISNEEMKVFNDYVRTISEIVSKGEVVKKMMRKIRESSSEEEAMVHYEKFKNTSPSIKFTFYQKVEDKMKAIRKITNTLDYFEVDYPPLPDSIKSFFE